MMGTAATKAAMFVPQLAGTWRLPVQDDTDDVNKPVSSWELNMAIKMLLVQSSFSKDVGPRPLSRRILS